MHGRSDYEKAWPSGYPGYVGGQVVAWLAGKGIYLRFPCGYNVTPAMIAAQPDDVRGSRRWRAFIEEHTCAGMSESDESYVREVLDGV